MRTKKTQKIEDLSQTHGKIEDIQHKTLDQIWGDTGGKYPTSNENDYLVFLNDMNKSDLQAHANKVGLVAIDNRENLTKRLVAEFKKYTSLFKIPKNRDNTVTLNKKIKDILSEGK